MTENLPIQIYPNKIKNRIVFKIKTSYKFELLTPETMKLLGIGIKKVDKNKDEEKITKLESVEVVLVQSVEVVLEWSFKKLQIFSTQNLLIKIYQDLLLKNGLSFMINSKKLLC